MLTIYGSNPILFLSSINDLCSLPSATCFQLVAFLKFPMLNNAPKMVCCSTGEIVALKWVDISDNYIHVNRTQIRYKSENGENIHEIRDTPKTETGIRDVVIVDALRPVIKALRKRNPFTEYVFEKNGECIHIHSVCARLYYLCDILGFQRKGMHALRRAYATKLINAGVEEIIILSQMGHTDIKTTRTHYYKNNSEAEYVFDRISSAICL